MTEREILEEVLKVVKSHGEELRSLKEGQQVLHEEFQGLSKEVQDLKTGQQVLGEKFQGLSKEVQDLKTGQQVLREEVQDLKTGQQVLREEVQELKTGQQILREEVQELKIGQQVLREDVQELRGQLDETNQIVKAIRHNQEYISAKLEGLEATTAKADAVRVLDNKFEVLNSRLFAQEVAMQDLRRVK